MAPFPVGLSSQPCLPIVTGDRGFTLLGEWEGASVSTFVICHQTLYPTLVTTLHSPVSPSSLSKKARATQVLFNTHEPSCLSLLDSWELFPRDRDPRPISTAPSLSIASFSVVTNKIPSLCESVLSNAAPNLTSLQLPPSDTTTSPCYLLFVPLPPPLLAFSLQSV